MASHDLKLERLLKDSSAVIHSVEATGKYKTTFISENIKSLLGYEAHEFIDNPEFWDDLIHPEDAARVFQAFDQLPQQGLAGLDYRIQHRDGSYRWVYHTIRLANEDTEAADQMVGFWLDITERKRMEEMLHESESKYRGVFDAAHDIIVLMDRNGDILDINHRAEFTLGYSADEMRTMNTFKHLYIPEDHAMMRETIADLVAGHKREYEVRCRTKDGRIVLLASASAPRFSSSGEFISTVCAARDITERHDKEQYMQLQARMLDAVGQAVIATDTAGAIIYWNKAAQALYGWSSGEVMGKSILEVTPTPISLTEASQILQLLKSGEKWSGEFSVQRKDGSTFPAVISNSPIFDNGGNFTGIIGVTTDLSELKRERELSELKSRFVAMVSHEFRTPLTAILSSTGLLETYKDRMSAEKQNEHLAKIRAQILRLTNLLDDVLTIGRADNMGVEFNPETVDLAAFCQNIVDEVQLISPTHQIDMSSSGDCTQATIDQKLFRQILYNMLTNAIKYSPDANSVRLELSCDPSTITLRFFDYGIGIPQADMKNLFVAFQRATNVSTIQGTGLGLTIVKQAVDAHNGSIDVSSQVGVGTTFTVTIPARGNKAFSRL